MTFRQMQECPRGRKRRCLQGHTTVWDQKVYNRHSGRPVKHAIVSSCRGYFVIDHLLTFDAREGMCLTAGFRKEWLSSTARRSGQVRAHNRTKHKREIHKREIHKVTLCFECAHQSPLLSTQHKARTRKPKWACASNLCVFFS